MTVLAEIQGAKAKLNTSYEPELSGQIVTINRAIVEPEASIDQEALPLFEIKLKNGEVQTVYPEELRSIDGAVVENSQIELGGHPVKDLHPLVNRVLLDSNQYAEI